MQIGSGKFIYEVTEWQQIPDGAMVPGVAVDSQDRVYAFARDPNAVYVYDREGRFLKSWGEGLFKRPHGMFIGPDDSVYCIDDWGHALYKFTTDGDLTLTIETTDHPADTGYKRDRQETLLRAGPPFCYPTGVALSQQGEIYVSDGYGNTRLHKFTPDGQLIYSIGDPGDGPGQFNIPHSVCVDQSGLVYVADRMNSRIQIFTPEGEYVTEWREVRRPDDMCLDAEGHMYVAELGYIMQPDEDGWRPDPSMPSGRITVRALSGEILAEWGPPDPQGADLYYAPHNIAINSRGDLYVGEVRQAYSGGAAQGKPPALIRYVRV